MIKEIEINNFGGIERMRIGAAKRLNIIVGRYRKNGIS